MAYLYARAISEARLELRFLQLWFVLEVFPMVGTSDISATDYMAQHVLRELTASEVKAKLERSLRKLRIGCLCWRGLFPRYYVLSLAKVLKDGSCLRYALKLSLRDRRANHP